MPADLARKRPLSRINLLSTLATRFTAGRGLPALCAHVLEQYPDAAIILENSTSQCLMFNNHALSLTGYSRNELSGRRLDDLLPPEDARQIRSAQRALAPGLSQTFNDVPLITQIGGRRHVDITLTNIAPPEVDAFMIAARPSDIRQAREAIEAEAIAHAEATVELTQLLDGMPDEVWEEAAAAAACLVSANMLALYIEDEGSGKLLLDADFRTPRNFPSWLPLDYRPASEVWDVGLASDDVLSRAAREARLGSLVQQTLGTEEGAHVVLVMGYRKRGGYEVRTQSIALVGSLLTSLAERRLRAEAVVELARAHHSQSILQETLQRLITCGLVVIDADGRITHINEAAQDLLGYPLEEARGRPFQEVLISRERLVPLVQRAIDEGVGVEGEEITLISREGAAVPVLLRVASVWPGTDLEESVLIVFDDRSHHKAMEARGRHLEQLSFLGEMSAIFAHEIRNPLAGISAGVEYVASKLPPDDPLQESLQMIHAESKRLNQLLGDILTVARPKPAEITATDIVALVARSLDRWRPRLGRKHIDVEFFADDDLPPVMVDPRELEQVLTNLFSNAIHAMSALPQRGTLSVHICMGPEDAGYVGYEGQRIQIDVGDTGPGMPPEVKRRVFEPFFTTKNGGTGLGLAIARRIISQHNGTLTVESWEGVGTVFTITLPAAAQALAPAVTVPDIAAPEES